MKFATYKLNAFLFQEIEIEKLMHKMPIFTFYKNLKFWNKIEILAAKLYPNFLKSSMTNNKLAL